MIACSSIFNEKSPRLNVIRKGQATKHCQYLLMKETNQLGARINPPLKSR